VIQLGYGKINGIGKRVERPHPVMHTYLGNRQPGGDAVIAPERLDRPLGGGESLALKLSIHDRQR
jgi:hypothetical protein